MSKKDASVRQRKTKRVRKVTQNEVTASFVACGRCSFFLTGYRLLHSDFEASVKESSDGWLSLSWNRATGDLVLKSYGGQIDLDLYYFEGICPDCKRRYVYASTSTVPVDNGAANAGAMDSAANDATVEITGVEDAAVKNDVVEESADEVFSIGNGEGGRPIFQIEVKPGKVK